MTTICSTVLGWSSLRDNPLVKRLSTASTQYGFKPLFTHGSTCITGAGTDWWPSRQHASTAISQFALVLGEPIARTAQELLSRSEWIDQLGSHHRESTLANHLACANGTFCGLSYDDGQLAIFTDRLGVRGIYWCVLDDCLVFASSIGAMTDILCRAGATLTKDHDGIAELAAFGISLGDRTTHKEIRRLRDSEYLQYKKNSAPIVQAYAHWQTNAPTTLSIGEAARQINDAFSIAVNDRLQAIGIERQNYSLLSGGMDSRYILAHLIQSTAKKPVTLNVAPEGSDDCLLGNHAAAQLGSAHFHLPTSTDLGQGLPKGIATIQQDSPQGDAHLWWSGDGGSVGLGHVYLDDSTTINFGGDESALAERLAHNNKWGLSERIFRPSWKHLHRSPINGMMAELARIQSFPTDRRAFAFLLFNDQQRHMHYHFDIMHTRQYDFVLPFFDPRLIHAVLRTPINFLLFHRIYNYIFSNLLPSGVRCAWQTYPGHTPCPYEPASQRGRNQWSDSWNDAAPLRLKSKQSGRELLKRAVTGDAPDQLSLPAIFIIGATLYAGSSSRIYLAEQIETIINSYQTND